MPKTISCKITKIVELNSQVKKYTLKLSKPVIYEPGQYLQLSLEHVTASEFWPDSRAFSIASFGSNTEIEIYVKKTGQFTSLIHQNLMLGDEISVKLPYGDFTLPIIEDDSRIVCISNGVGITPFLSFIDCLNHQDKMDCLYIFHTFRFTSDLIGDDKLVNTSSSNLNLFITGSKDERFVNRRMLEYDITKFNFSMDTFFYVSGSIDFINDIELMLSKLGFKKIFKDQW